MVLCCLLRLPSRTTLISYPPLLLFKIHLLLLLTIRVAAKFSFMTFIIRQSCTIRVKFFEKKGKRRLGRALEIARLSSFLFISCILSTLTHLLKSFCFFYVIEVTLFPVIISHILCPPGSIHPSSEAINVVGHIMGSYML